MRGATFMGETFRENFPSEFLPVGFFALQEREAVIRVRA